MNAQLSKSRSIYCCKKRSFLCKKKAIIRKSNSFLCSFSLISQFCSLLVLLQVDLYGSSPPIDISSRLNLRIYQQTSLIYYLLKQFFLCISTKTFIKKAKNTILQNNIYLPFFTLQPKTFHMNFYNWPSKSSFRLMSTILAQEISYVHRSLVVFFRVSLSLYSILIFKEN